MILGIWTGTTILLKSAMLSKLGAFKSNIYIIMIQGIQLLPQLKGFQFAVRRLCSHGIRKNMTPISHVYIPSN